MHLSLLNSISALVIGFLIALMAAVKSPALKALIYSLPIPITVALIATKGKVNSSNVMGLVLLCLYLWLVYFLHNRYRIAILLADIGAAFLYITFGYGAIKYIHVPFFLVCGAYAIGWACIVSLLHTNPLNTPKTKPSTMSPAKKGILTSFIALLLFSLKDILKGLVVTFPFSGVFAVIEAKNHLDTLARIFLRNSIAILAFFILVYLLPLSMTLGVKLAIAWISYMLILKLVNQIKV